MQSSIKRLTDTKVSLSIIASAEEISVAKQEAIAKLGANLTIAGFRAGKVPPNIIEKNLDLNLLGQETLEIAINAIYPKALISNQIRAVNQPQIELKKFVPFSQLEFSAEVEAIGDISLGNYKDLKIILEPAKVDAKEVNEILSRLQNQSAQLSVVNRPAKQGDQLIIDFKGIDAVSKQPISGASSQDYPLILGSNSFIPGFEDKLIKAKTNESLEFDIIFPADYPVKSLQNTKVNFSVTVKKINERKLPELNDQFASSVGPFKDLTALKADIKSELIKTKQDEALNNLKNRIVDRIVTSSKVAIPKELIEEETKRIEAEERQNAAYRGLTWDEYLNQNSFNEADFNDLAQKQALSRVKTGLVLGEIASIEKVSVTEQELNEKLDSLKKQYVSDTSMLNELAKAENIRDINSRLLVEKTLDRLVELNKA